MIVADMMQSGGRVFLKSVFGQIGDDWPCVSFSRPSVGTRLRQEFVPGRDVMIYVGTLNRELTRDPDHRGRLIAAVVIEPSQILETRKIVSSKAWANSDERWPHSMAVLNAAILKGPPFPDAHNVVPDAYRSFGNVENRGGVVLAEGDERAAVMALAADPLEIHLAPDVQAYVGLRASYSADIPKSVKEQATRMAGLIIERVKKGGEPRVVINPQRTAPGFADLYKLLVDKWHTDQRGLCALCNGVLVATTMNKMLQPSADRIDSSNGAYDAANVHVTHLACNLAKNQYGLDHFEEWLVALRGADPRTDG